MVVKKLISTRGNDFLKKFSSTAHFYSIVYIRVILTDRYYISYRILSSIGFLIILLFSKILIQCYVNCTVQNRRESRELETELNTENIYFRSHTHLSARSSRTHHGKLWFQFDAENRLSFRRNFIRVH